MKTTQKTSNSPASGPTVSPGGATAAPDAGARVDQPLVARAYRKLMDHQEPTASERAALKRHEKGKEERLRWQYYGTIPQKHWRSMSGRQAKVINEQAQRYGLPFGGAMVNLPVLVRGIHDFLADNAAKLARDDNELMQGSPGVNSPALERYREERAELAKLDRLERQGRLLPRDQVRQAMGRIAAIVRGAGQTLQQQFGPTALEILNEALDDARQEVERTFVDQVELSDPAPAESDTAHDDNGDIPAEA